MKKPIFTILALFFAFISFAQVGIGTTTPNSTLDVRGSVSTNYRSFTASTSASATDNLLVFTGSSAATLTLPTAVGCDGRTYMIKNASTTGPTPVVTIATTSAQTIDGAGSWTLTSANETITLISNGANWNISAQSLPGGSGVNWTQNGNSLASTKTIGTISNHSLPFITNNTEKMRLTNSGNLGIGTSSFNGTYPEKLLVDAGTTTSVNAIVGKGSIDSYLQLNIQNNSSGTNSSSDVVATANNGNETTNYVDMGINGGNNTSGVMGVANDAYLYNIGQNMLIGTGSASKSLVFMTGGTTQSTNERMRIDGNGKLGLGTNAIPKAGIGLAKFAIEGTDGSTSGPHMQFTTSADNYPLMQFMPWQHDFQYIPFDAYFDGTSWKSGTTVGGNFVLAKESGKFLWYYGNVNTQGSAITWSPGVTLNNAGKVGIGTSTFDATNPEKLLVDAGTTTSFNVISGKGTINNYLQLNIQNKSTGSAASSDVVATADNGTESVNFVDLGINSSGYSSSGILGGSNNAYLYATGNDFVIGNGTSAKDLILFTGGTATTNERLRLTANGVTVTGSMTVSYRSGTGAYTILATDHAVINTGGAATWTLPAASGCAGRVYRLVNQGTGNITLSIAVTTANGTTTTTLVNTAGSNFFEILSDGTNWRRIN